MKNRYTILLGVLLLAFTVSVSYAQDTKPPGKEVKCVTIENQLLAANEGVAIELNTKNISPIQTSRSDIAYVKEGSTGLKPATRFNNLVKQINDQSKYYSIFYPSIGEYMQFDRC